MTKNNTLQAVSESFGLIFLLERKLEYIFDRILASDNLTAKQWLVLAAIEKLCKQKPSIQEVAKLLATSHQNIKAISLNLAKGGFVTLEKDPKDKRVTRLSTTDKSKAFWQGREAEDKAFLLELFKNLSDQEKFTLLQSLGKLLQGTDELAERINREKEQCNE
jgi:DNA-binding MarR family transcriptional regulator